MPTTVHEGRTRKSATRALTDRSSEPISERSRLQIDFTPAAFLHLKKMRERAGVKTAADVAKNALRLYDWYLEKQEEGYQILLSKGDVVKHVELLL